MHELGLPSPLYKQSQGVTLNRDFSAKKPTYPNPFGSFLHGDKIQSVNCRLWWIPILSSMDQVILKWESLSLLASAITFIWRRTCGMRATQFLQKRESCNLLQFYLIFDTGVDSLDSMDHVIDNLDQFNQTNGPLIHLSIRIQQKRGDI